MHLREQCLAKARSVMYGWLQNDLRRLSWHLFSRNSDSVICCGLQQRSTYIDFRFRTGRQQNCGEHTLRKIAIPEGGVSNLASQHPPQHPRIGVRHQLNNCVCFKSNKYTIRLFILLYWCDVLAKCLVYIHHCIIQKQTKNITSLAEIHVVRAEDVAFVIYYFYLHNMSCGALMRRVSSNDYSAEILQYKLWGPNMFC